jgi:GMP synthase (glutamine-hydrolysing)
MEFNPIPKPLRKLLENFAVGMCNAKQDWTMEKFVDKELERVSALVGEKGQGLGAVSGGVDSTVGAKLILEVIGDRHAALIYNGVMRLHRCEQINETLTEYLGINFTVVDASGLFLKGLKRITDNQEHKWKFISNIFIVCSKQKPRRLKRRRITIPKLEWSNGYFKEHYIRTSLKGYLSKAQALRSRRITMSTAY